MSEVTPDEAGPARFAFELPAWELRLLEACERLLELVPERGTVSTRERAAQLFPVIALLYRATNTYDATLSLIRQGFGEQGVMLNRSLFEDMVDAHWTFDNPTDATERWHDHARYSQLLGFERASKYIDLTERPAEAPSLAVIEMDDGERKRLAKFYGDFGERSWTGIPVYRRVEAIAHLWTQPDEQRFLRFFRDVGGQMNNETLHPSPRSMYRQVLPPPAPSEVTTAKSTVLLRRGPSTELFRQALLGAMWPYAQLLALAYDAFHLPDQERVVECYVEAMRLLFEPTAEQRRTTGRNARCPCGSGRKYKNCHLGNELASA